MKSLEDKVQQISEKGDKTAAMVKKAAVQLDTLRVKMQESQKDWKKSFDSFRAEILASHVQLEDLIKESLAGKSRVKRDMCSSEEEQVAPYLVCELDNVKGLVDALSSVRWELQQDAVVELSENGIVFTVEETSCLQAKVYLPKELFVRYEFNTQGWPRFGVSLGLFVDCLNTFSVSEHSTPIEFQYPGPDMQLLLRFVDSLNQYVYADIKTRIPVPVSRHYNFEPAEVPLSFTVKSAALKEAVGDLELPGSSIIQITLQPDPPSLIFRAESDGDLQAEFMCSSDSDLMMAFECSREVSYRYKYKVIWAATSNMPGSVIEEDIRTKMSFGRGGLLKVQYAVPMLKDLKWLKVYSVGYRPPTRTASIEFLMRPEEEETIL